ncbi:MULTISPECIES: MFS transporter [Anaerolinea]|uniref:MFS transporter n=1 Tax=Anaerolinea TaxID=233189 RepID=UPI00260D8DF0|nr:MFS transporter [Anaerolinea thermophila]
MAHPLIQTLKNVRGNARGAILSEPLWGIPFNLYAPYFSVYMRALGLTDSQIGLLVSLGLAMQFFWGLLGGIITDKLGRKRTTFIFDALSWSIPTLLWATARSFYSFLAAVPFNSAWRVTHNSWTLVLVEDTDPEELVEIYSWIYIAGQLAVFFAPIAGLLIARFGLVPTMRGLLLLACVMMTAKFIVMNAMVTETRQGKIRMEETRHRSIFSLLLEYRDVLGILFRSPATLYTLGIHLAFSIAATVSNTFWSILVTEKLHIPAAHLSFFPIAKSAIMLTFFFLITPRLRGVHFRNPMVLSFLGYMVAYSILLLTPAGNYPLLFLSVTIETCSFAVLGTQMDRLLVVTMNAEERARLMALFVATLVAATSPFGWIAGQLSSIDRNLPFVLCLIMYVIGIVLVLRAARLPENQPQSREVPAG